jgi:hypothetical protein
LADSKADACTNEAGIDLRGGRILADQRWARYLAKGGLILLEYSRG